MDSASFYFVLFGLLAAALSNLRDNAGWRSFILFASSAVFLALLGESVVALLPLLAFLLLGYAGVVIIRQGRHRYLTWLIVVVIFTFIWLKKYAWLPSGIFLQVPYVTLGLSYIFFRILHLLIESSTSEAKDSPRLGQFLLYTLNFTTLVCGPIQRYEEFAAEQFAPRKRALSIQIIGLQLERIIRGFFKVNILAMLLRCYHDDAIARLVVPLTWGQKMFALSELAILYPLFLYANFSGYIDIVIGLARLMCVQLPENFDRPFSSPSVMEFWNRWHITLSAWFKGYVFNPLIFMLMRRFTSLEAEPFLGVLSFFLTFFLVGIWHGRTSEFVMFGILTGAGISVNKLWQLTLIRWHGRKGYKNIAGNALYIALGRGLTFSWFALTLFWFWADWPRLHRIAGTATVTQWLGLWLAIWVGSAAVLELWEWTRSRLLSIRTAEGPILASRYALVVYTSAMAFAALLIRLLLNQPAPGIVYRTF